MNFRLYTQPLGDRMSSYGVGLAISNQVDIVDVKFIPYSNSCQGRGLLYVQTPTWIFVTAHLESFVDARTYDGVVAREAQLLQATLFCERRMEEYPHLQWAVIAGDLNWDDERVGPSKASEGPPNRPLRDVVGPLWLDPGQPFDYTYDSEENPMLSGTLRRRVDRCIYSYNKNNHNHAKKTTTTFRKLGMKAIPELTWNKKDPRNGTSETLPVAPSDHFGIAITFHSDDSYSH